MSTTPNLWLLWASKLMPVQRAEWMQAMESEMMELSGPDERAAFARGCFLAALKEWAHSRKGLSIIARIGGATFLGALSIFGISAASSMALVPGQEYASQTIIGLCVIYLCSAILLLTSLKGLKVFSAVGFVGGLAISLLVRNTQTSDAGYYAEFQSAIYLEASGLMGVLFLATLYLGFLYSPDEPDFIPNG